MLITYGHCGPNTPTYTCAKAPQSRAGRKQTKHMPELVVTGVLWVCVCGEHEKPYTL